MVGMSQSVLASNTFRTTACVNLRSEPSTNASVVTVVYTGTNVDVLEHDPAGWSRVQAGSSTGYIRSDFLKFPIGNTPATFRTTAGVNIRASASTDANILDTVVSGTSVEVLDHDPAGWSRVRHDGSTGFIRSDFLTRTSGSGSGGSGSSNNSSSSSSTTSVGTLRTTGNVNFRTSPSSENNNNLIRTLAARTAVEVLEQRSDGWSSVRHNNETGYIRSDFLSETGAPTTTITLRTTTGVNFRNRPSTTNSTVYRTLTANTAVEVLEQRTDGWSNIRHNNTTGYVRSEYLSATGSSVQAGTMLRVSTPSGARLRSGPSQDHRRLRTLAANTSVEVVERLSNGWTRVRHNGDTGYIRSDLLGAGVRAIELIDWSEARRLIPMRRDMRVTDVRTGISFNLRAFALSGHADVETPTQADTDAILRTRGGVWAWAPRPVWVTIGERTFAAALNGMPHDVSTIRDNGMNGHLCLHFNNTVTRSSSYQRNLNNAVTEAWNKRPH